MTRFVKNTCSFQIEEGPDGEITMVAQISTTHTRVRPQPIDLHFRTVEDAADAITYYALDPLGFLDLFSRIDDPDPGSSERFCPYPPLC